MKKIIFILLFTYNCLQSTHYEDTMDAGEAVRSIQSVLYLKNRLIAQEKGRSALVDSFWSILPIDVGAKYWEGKYFKRNEVEKCKQKILVTPMQEEKAFSLYMFGSIVQVCELKEQHRNDLDKHTKDSLENSF